MKISRDLLRKLSPEDIQQAIRYGVLERRRERLQGRLDEVLKEQAKLEGNGSTRPRQTRRTAPKGKPAPVRRKRKPLSRATRLKMALSAKLRWRKIKEGKAGPAKDVVSN